VRCFIELKKALVWTQKDETNGALVSNIWIFNTGLWHVVRRKQKRLRQQFRNGDFCE
jgi:hypothetical protein